jgi:type II secretory pathway component PulJ
MNQAFSNRNSRIAFTLVEMLVSVAVLILIMTFIAQMMNSTTLSTTLSGKQVDTDAEARLVLDRMAVDFGRMSRRSDVDFLFSKQPEPITLHTSSSSDGGTSGTSASMFFYSEAPAYAASSTSGSNYNSTVALIGYYLNTTGSAEIGVPAYSLQRLSKGLTLNALSSQGSSDGSTDAMLFLTSTGQGGLPLAASSLGGAESAVIGTSESNYQPSDMSDYDVLSPEVLRMDFCFQVKDLSNPNAPGTVYSNFPIAYFQSGAANITTIADVPPSQQPLNGQLHPVVGDRYYDTDANRGYVCTSLISTTTTAGTQTLPIWTPNGLADVDAIVVGIAILDQNTRRPLQASPNYLSYLGQLSSALLTPTDAALNPKSSNNPDRPPQLMADLWQTELNKMLPGLQSSNPLLATAVAQLHVYQRFFYLNNN